MEFVSEILPIVRRIIAYLGVAIILWGALRGFLGFCTKRNRIDQVRLEFGRVIVLGLEFIVAADVIATTSDPDYYNLGILAGLVLIRTFLSYFLNGELKAR